MKEWIEELKWEIKDKIKKFYRKDEPYFKYPEALRLIAEIEQQDSVIEGQRDNYEKLGAENIQLTAIVEKVKEYFEMDNYIWVNSNEEDEDREKITTEIKQLIAAREKETNGG